jgi:hypothetical protein
MSVPSARFFFDAGSGIALWAANAETRARWDYPIDIDDLPVSATIRTELDELLERHDASFNWSDPTGSTPWPEAECARFNADARAWLNRLRAELGPTWTIHDEFRELHRDPVQDQQSWPIRGLLERDSDLAGHPDPGTLGEVGFHR